MFCLLKALVLTIPLASPDRPELVEAQVAYVRAQYASAIVRREREREKKD
jgi:hypothetical protein